MKRKGIAGAGGIAVASVYCFREEKLQVEERLLDEQQRPAELAHYRTALHTAGEQLQEIYDGCVTHDADKAEIFQAHLDLLRDVQVQEEIECAILSGGQCAPWAVRSVYEIYAGVLGESDDERMRERAADLRDVSLRLQRLLLGLAPETSLAQLPDGVILAAHDLMPSQTVALDAGRIGGIVTEAGGATSHTAILARSFGIPAVLGVEKLLETLHTGDTVIMDGSDGTLILDPTPEECSLYKSKREAFLKQRAYEQTFLPRAAITEDGVSVSVNLNIGDGDDSHYRDLLPYVDGVGLFRSEFLYLSRKTLPSEQEQYEIYARTLQNFGERPVILRTLDIGGDKQTDCIDLPQEENPFLGLRALRLCFSMPALFRTQLRAAYRAAVHGNLWMMFPMVNSLEDFRRAKAICEAVCRELEAEGIPYGKQVRLGIMIETPSIALMAKEAAAEVDFASIGTNDLCQYTLAVDRMNATVRPYYMAYHPAVLRLLASVAAAFEKAEKPVSVCGELGGDPAIIPVLVGLGIHKLSMSASAVATAKAVICGLNHKKAQLLAQQALNAATEQEVRLLLERSELSWYPRN